MKGIVFVLALGAVSASLALAGPFNQLCDTGVSNCSTESPNTTQVVTDSNYSVTSGPSGTSTTAETFFTGGYYTTSSPNPIGTATASWITPYTTAGAPSQSVGTFNLQQAIVANVTGTVTISGSWAVDNCGTIAWGSTPVAVATGTGLTIDSGVGANCFASSSAFDALTAFSFNESVVVGTTYFLDFEIGNPSVSPTALLVDSLTASCAVGAVCPGTMTPEPSSVVLTLTGVALLGLGVRRRRARA